MSKNLKEKIWRVMFYAAGCVLLAIGITLTTKAGLGVSTIISVPFVISNIWNLNFAVMTFLVYSVMVGIQFLLRGKNYRLSDLLQIPFSMVFSWFLNFFGGMIEVRSHSFAVRLLFLIIALIITGCGAAMMANMKLIMNPADGLAQTAGEILHKDFGFGKNLIDFLCVALSVLLGLFFTGKLIGIGIGTILAMVGIGRIITLFNRIFRKEMFRLAGLA